VIPGLRRRALDALPLLVVTVPLLVVAPLSGTPSGYRGFDAGAWVISGLAVGLLAFRVRWPIVVLSVEALAAIGYAAIGYAAGGPYWCVMVALYGVGRHYGWRTVLLATVGAVTSIWICGVVGRGPAISNATTWGSALTVAVVLAGREMRQRELLEIATSERVRIAEASRAQEAARRVSEERVRISREMHDVIGHSLAMIGVQAGVGAHVIDERPVDAKEALLAIKKTSKDALNEIRRTLNALRDDTDTTREREPAPGLDQLDQLISRAGTAELPTDVEVTGTVAALPAAVDLAAYRVVQESLTNAIKYAAPASARLHLTYTPSALHIELIDNGTTGPADNRTADTAPGGHGLRGMRERVTALGGWLEAGPLDPTGYRVHACLPTRAGQ
jgi:signal transduction histidine kinase